MSVRVTEFGAPTEIDGNVHEGAFDWMRSVALVPKLSSDHTPANVPHSKQRRAARIWLTML